MDLGSNRSSLDNECIDQKVLENNMRDDGKCDIDDKVQTEGKSSATGSPPSAATKGRRLKKWRRRVHRGLGKPANTNLDPSVLTGETRQRSNVSVSWKNAIDSEKNSTATGTGERRGDSNAIRNLGITDTLELNVSEQVQGRLVIGKKARGVEIEKEKSHSTMESDSQSSNFLSKQSTNGREANGCHDDADNNGKQFRKSDAEDVVAVSMLKLHSAQEALKREVQNLKDSGKDDPLFLDEEEEASNAEAEFEVISKSMEHLDQLKLMIARQRKLASQQVETMNRVENAETKAVQLKKQAVRLNKTCQEILDKEEAFKLKTRICRLCTCFSIQLMLFLLVVYLFVLQFYSHKLELLLVPT